MASHGKRAIACADTPASKRQNRARREGEAAEAETAIVSGGPAHLLQCAFSPTMKENIRHWRCLVGTRFAPSVLARCHRDNVRCAGNGSSGRRSPTSSRKICCRIFLHYLCATASRKPFASTQMPRSPRVFAPMIFSEPLGVQNNVMTEHALTFVLGGRVSEGHITYDGITCLGSHRVSELFGFGPISKIQGMLGLLSLAKSK
eukprot:CAMPEP_0175967956 /NCGR_PEP_ID=MMETSP0108-20121206/39614_1 /TAXON_ID=195067 ORGANISM="Goniomonas pacifica, Strain CCMP1869" /NCGR_SAMPLE_ID=MMETSP0108 /ASSEMBLY_ACC=CAM_ASM_000204 /LENGTH=202 /DNA_ID=CAMNT_0017296525 /DNA_START=128 /DNA_END=733 /DNA_ORIENTATION=+